MHYGRTRRSTCAFWGWDTRLPRMHVKTLTLFPDKKSHLNLWEHCGDQICVVRAPNYLESVSRQKLAKLIQHCWWFCLNYGDKLLTNHCMVIDLGSCTCNGLFIQEIDNLLPPCEYLRSITSWSAPKDQLEFMMKVILHLHWPYLYFLPNPRPPYHPQHPLLQVGNIATYDFLKAQSQVYVQARQSLFVRSLSLTALCGFQMFSRSPTLSLDTVCCKPQVDREMGIEPLLPPSAHNQSW